MRRHAKSEKPKVPARRSGTVVGRRATRPTPVARTVRATRPEAGSVAHHVDHLLGSADIALLRLGLDRRVVRFSLPATRLFRLQASDLGRPIEEVVARFDDPQLSEDVAAVLLDACPREKEVLGEERRWYLRRIAPYRTHDGHIEGVVLTFRDVTALKRAQSELRGLASELEQRVARRTAELEAEVTKRERLQQALGDERNFVTAILGTAGALIVVLDPAGRIERFNQVCEAVTGRSEAEVWGQTWDMLVAQEERDAVCAGFDALVAGRFPSMCENHWVHRDGSRRLIAWSNTCLCDARGRVDCVIGIGIDVTERRKAEDEALQRQAESARLHRVHAVGQLAALLAHELNQPLAAITHYVEASLRQADDPARLERNLEQILTQARRANESIRVLLHHFLSKDSPGQPAADVGAALRAACLQLQALARACGVHLVWDCDAPLPMANAQAMQVEHILVNLLQNAIDAIRGAGMTRGNVTVRARRAGRDGVLVSVVDDGPGLDAAHLKQVFEPLRTGKPGGLGLGLSICRSIIEAQGGRIWAEPGPGGKFSFVLPVA